MSSSLTERRVIVAVFRNQTTAQRTIDHLNDLNFPLDSISILGKASASGDDYLGIYYEGVGERMRAWGMQGAFWGGLWGLLASAAGTFVIPGLGTILAGGPVVEAISSALAAAAVSGGVMAATAPLSHLATALHSLGIPEGKLHNFHDAIKDGHYVMVLRCSKKECSDWRKEVSRFRPDALEDFTYYP